jgi:hypothetical protein
MRKNLGACAVAGCAKPAERDSGLGYFKSMCSTHLWRKRVYGEPGTLEIRPYVRSGLPPKPRPTLCEDCGEARDGRGGKFALCAACRARRRRLADRRRNLKRIGVRIVDAIDLFDLGRRDGWGCHLCGESCDPSLSHLDRRYPTVDHLVPVSDGGEDSWANVKIAHRGCNSSRGNKPLAA